VTLKAAIIQALIEVGYTEEDATRKVIIVGSCHGGMVQLNDDCIPEDEAREAIDTMKERFGYFKENRDEANEVRIAADKANANN